MQKSLIKVINLNKKVRNRIIKLMIIVSILTIAISCVFFMIKGESSTYWLRNSYFAHRGLFDNEIPENSLKAFENAINNDFAIELDVQFTKDKKVVVFHDYTLERIVGISKNINDLNYDELKKLYLLNTKEKIPLLEDVLKMVNGRVPILIEIKNCNNILELGEEVYNLLKDYNGKYAIQSFDVCVLEKLKRKDKNILVGQLIGNYDGRNEFRHCTNILLDFEKFFLKYKLDFLSIDFYDLNNFAIKFFRFLRVPVLSWTIQNNEKLEEIKGFADGYIFDSFIPAKEN